MPDPAVLERFIARVEANAHAEAIEAFYAENASMQANDAPPRIGRDRLVAHERKVLARARSVRSTCIRPVFVSGDKVVIRWVFDFEWLDWALDPHGGARLPALGRRPDRRGAVLLRSGAARPALASAAVALLAVQAYRGGQPVASKGEAICG